MKNPTIETSASRLAGLADLSDLRQAPADAAARHDLN